MIYHTAVSVLLCLQVREIIQTFVGLQQNTYLSIHLHHQGSTQFLALSLVVLGCPLISLYPERRASKAALCLVLVWLFSATTAAVAYFLLLVVVFIFDIFLDLDLTIISVKYTN